MKVILRTGTETTERDPANPDVVLVFYICIFVLLYLHEKYHLISIYLKICVILDNNYTMRLDLNY